AQLRPHLGAGPGGGEQLAVAVVDVGQTVDVELEDLRGVLHAQPVAGAETLVDPYPCRHPYSLHRSACLVCLPGPPVWSAPGAGPDPVPAPSARDAYPDAACRRDAPGRRNSTLPLLSGRAAATWSDASRRDQGSMTGASSGAV